MEIQKSLTVQYEASQEEVSILWEKMVEFNKDIGPMLAYPPYEPYRILLRNETNEIVAGILTKIYLKCMYVELLWVNKEQRGHQIGSQLLEEVEGFARENDCRFIHLDTFSFQAIGFYKKLGYTVFGILDDYPGGVERYYLKKNL
jgi:GNAT superfamily N-acetyltransferase